MGKLLQTDNSWAGLFGRMALAAVFLPHGAQKFLGWFGGHGLAGTLDAFTGMGMPWIVALLIIIGEFFGPLGLFLGLLGRVAAGGLLVIMLGAVFMVHLEHGFFMNWFGLKAGEGFEYHILAIGLCLSVIVTGSGKWSIDRVLGNKVH